MKEKNCIICEDKGIYEFTGSTHRVKCPYCGYTPPKDYGKIAMITVVVWAFVLLVIMAVCHGCAKPENYAPNHNHCGCRIK